MNATHNVVKNNTTFKAYYDAKRVEGRTHYNALGHCAGKLVRVSGKCLLTMSNSISIDSENAPLGNFIKVTLFYH